MNRQLIQFRHLGHQVGAADGFNHFAGLPTHHGQVLNQNWDQDLGGEKFPRPIDRGDPIAVAIKDQPHGQLVGMGLLVVANLGDRAGGVFGQRFRRAPFKQRIAIGVQLLHGNIQHLAEAAGRSAMHRIHKHRQLAIGNGSSDGSKINKLPQRFTVAAFPRIKRLDRLRMLHLGRNRFGRQHRLNLLGHLRRHGTPKGSLDLQTQITTRIVAGRQDDRPKSLLMVGNPAKDRRGGIAVRQLHPIADRLDGFSGHPRKIFSHEPAIVAHQNGAAAGAGPKLLGQRFRRQRGYPSHPLDREVRRNYPPPTIRTEFDRAGRRRSQRLTHESKTSALCAAIPLRLGI